MGNSSRKADVYVSVENPVVFPGEDIVGAVHFGVRRRIRDGSLVLAFKGESRAEQGLVTVSVGTPIFRYFGNCVCSWEHSDTGDFSLPFSLVVPNELPPTTKAEFPLSFLIWYVVIARVMSGEDMIAEFEAPVHVKPFFSPYDISNTLIDQKEVHERFCCFKVRSYTVHASIEQRVFTPDDTATITLVFDNPGTSFKIKKIDVSLQQRFSIYSGCFLIPEDRQVAHAVSSAQVESGKTTVLIDFPFQDCKGTLGGVYSCKTNLATCQYFFEIKFKSGCLGHTAIELYVLIAPSSELEVDVPALPPVPDDWDPMTLDRVSLMEPRHVRQASKLSVSEDEESILND